MLMRAASSDLDTLASGAAAEAVAGKPQRWMPCRHDAALRWWRGEGNRLHDRLNGQPVDLPSAGGFGGFVVGDQLENVERRYFTDTVALTVPDLSAIRLACRLFGDPDGATLGVGRITALKVNAIN